MISKLRRYWQELLLITILVTPVLSLLALGVVWLWQTGRLIEWAFASAALGIVAWPLRNAIRRRAIESERVEHSALAKPSAEWNAADHDAFEKVLALANNTQPLTSFDQSRMIALAIQTFDTVARHYHPDASDPWARVTVPEALLLVERVSRDVRHQALKNLPGVRTFRISHALWIDRKIDQHSDKARIGYEVVFGLRRVITLLTNPASVIFHEVRDNIIKVSSGALFLRITTYFTRLFLIEIGRSAIDLYSGRLKLSPEELKDAQEEDFKNADGVPAGPIRIVLVGQINAGKSSLLNAMAKEVRSAVGPIPTTVGPQEHALTVENQPVVTIVDTPGIDDRDVTSDALLAEIRRADLVLWVATANQPARAPDRRYLDIIQLEAASELNRKRAPILLALTHVDQLKPTSEWSPPYDIRNPRNDKARSIRAATQAVSEALGLAKDVIIPISLRPGADPYNVDAVWAKISGELSEAQLVQLDRLRLQKGGLNFLEILKQAASAGRVMVKAVSEGR
jgi:predicted GTPase